MKLFIPAIIVLIVFIVFRLSCPPAEKYSIMLGDSRNRMIVNEKDLLAIASGLIPKKLGKVNYEDVSTFVRVAKNDLLEKASKRKDKFNPRQKELFDTVEQMVDDKDPKYDGKQLKTKGEFIEALVDLLIKQNLPN